MVHTLQFERRPVLSKHSIFSILSHVVQCLPRHSGITGISAIVAPFARNGLFVLPVQFCTHLSWTFANIRQSRQCTPHIVIVGAQHRVQHRVRIPEIVHFWDT